MICQALCFGFYFTFYVIGTEWFSIRFTFINVQKVSPLKLALATYSKQRIVYEVLTCC